MQEWRGVVRVSQDRKRGAEIFTDCEGWLFWCGTVGGMTCHRER